MTYGIRIYEPSTGKLMIDITTSMTRVLGIYAVSTVAASGSLSVPEFSLGIPWFSILMDDDWPTVTSPAISPIVTTTSSSLDWFWDDNITRNPCNIIYGIR